MRLEEKGLLVTGQLMWPGVRWTPQFLDTKSQLILVPKEVQPISKGKSVQTVSHGRTATHGRFWNKLMTYHRSLIIHLTLSKYLASATTGFAQRNACITGMMSLWSGTKITTKALAAVGATAVVACSVTTILKPS